jgi:hypothetical protein
MVHLDFKVTNNMVEYEALLFGMPGTPREMIEHHLKIYPDARSVQPKHQK